MTGCVAIIIYILGIFTHTHISHRSHALHKIWVKHFRKQIHMHQKKKRLPLPTTITITTQKSTSHVFVVVVILCGSFLVGSYILVGVIQSKSPKFTEYLMSDRLFPMNNTRYLCIDNNPYDFFSFSF